MFDPTIITLTRDELVAVHVKWNTERRLHPSTFDYDETAEDVEALAARQADQIVKTLEELRSGIGPGSKVRHVQSGNVEVIDRRKEDGSGWWLVCTGGLSDRVLLSGEWAVVVEDDGRSKVPGETGPECVTVIDEVHVHSTADLEPLSTSMFRRFAMVQADAACARALAEVGGGNWPAAMRAADRWLEVVRVLDAAVKATTEVVYAEPVDAAAKTPAAPPARSLHQWWKDELEQAGKELDAKLVEVAEGRLRLVAELGQALARGES